MSSTSEQALDQQELRQLVDSCGTALDERDTVAFLALFLPEASLTVRHADADPRAHWVGRELAAAIAGLSRYVRTMHLTANHRFRIDGDRADGQIYCLAHHLRESSQGVEDLLMMVCYRDQYARVPQGWRFASRDVQILWAELHPASVDPLAL